MFKIFFALAFYVGIIWIVYFGMKLLAVSNPIESRKIIKKGIKGSIVAFGLSLVFLLLHFII